MSLFIVLLAGCGGDSDAVATASLAPAAGSVRLAVMPEPEALLRGIEFGEIDPSEIRMEWASDSEEEGEGAEDDAQAVAETESVGSAVADFVEDVGARWKDASAPAAAIARVVEEPAKALVAPDASIAAPAVAVVAPELEVDPAAGMSVDQVIRRYASQTQYCHETAKERYSQVEGRVSVAWDVVDGEVVDVQIVDDTTGDPQMAGCVARKVRYWRFPEGMDAEVEHPFVFQRAI